MSNVTLVDTINAGLNNPEYAFFVGQSMGHATAGMLIVKVTIIYFVVKIVDKLLFSKIPQLWKHLSKKK